VLLEAPGDDRILVEAGSAGIPGEHPVREQDVHDLVVALVVGPRLEAKVRGHTLQVRIKVGIRHDDVLVSHERRFRGRVRCRVEGNHGHQAGNQLDHRIFHPANEKARMREACGPEWLA